MMVATRSHVRVHPDGETSRRARDVKIALRQLAAQDPGLRRSPERANDLLDELSVAIRWDYL